MTTTKTCPVRNLWLIIAFVHKGQAQSLTGENLMKRLFPEMKAELKETKK